MQVKCLTAYQKIGYQQLVSQLGEAVGIADGEPYWNAYLGQWQVWVKFVHGCKSVVCDWLVGV